MTSRALLRLAWRESRTARKRLALYMSSIALGVAALVAIDSFAGNVTASIREQSRTLLGGDLGLQTRAAFPVSVDTLLDSLGKTGVRSARLTTLASMAFAVHSGGTRLVQLRAVSRGFPFYGTIETIPPAAWSRVHDEPLVFVDASLLVSVDAAVGDSLKLGTKVFIIGGTLGNVPGDAGITAVIGPRIYVSDRWLPETGLVRFGSRAEYNVVLQLPTERAGARDAAILARALRRKLDPRGLARNGAARQSNAREQDDQENADTTSNGRRTGSAIANSAEDPSTAASADSVAVATALRADSASLQPPRARIRIRTVTETERDFTEAVSRLADFLGVIGLIALMLGGIGVASGVNAFVAAKIDTVAMLRCLGATSKQVLSIYVVQAAAMGFVGAGAGTLIGIAIQYGLPHVVADFLPLNVAVELESRAVLIGLATGVWVALIFAMRPLLALRRVSPLQALRRSTDDAAVPREWRDPARLIVDALLVASVAGITISRMETSQQGLIVTAAIAGAVAILWVAATLLIALARRSVRPSWTFTLRQGIANLHRPANQTRAVTLALGFGAFLLCTIYLVQANLLGGFQTAGAASTGNLLFFDVQDNQEQPLDSLIRANGQQVVQATPIVTMRLQSVNGRSTTQLLADTTVQRQGWALRREFRSTYRDTLVSSEKLTTGKWFPDSAARALKRQSAPDTPHEVSLESDVANSLGVKVGDTLVWNVQGVPVRTIFTNIRTVNWARFEANFFVVFVPEAVRAAPQQYVIVANVTSPEALIAVQRDAVRKFPNVSSLDLTLVRKTIGDIIDRVTVAVRFLGLFALAMGVPVLFSAVAATRRSRIREGVLLRTLGASRRQVARILLAEYGALGALGALTGLALAFGGAWGLTHYVFKDPFHPAIGATLAIAFGMIALTMAIGFLTSRDVYRETPMAAIRET